MLLILMIYMRWLIVGMTRKEIREKKYNMPVDDYVLLDIGGFGGAFKFPKNKQDLRIDLPTVGLKTLIQCKYVGLKGIVLKNKQNVFLEKKKCISFANKNKMFITVK